MSSLSILLFVVVVKIPLTNKIQSKWHHSAGSDIILVNQTPPQTSVNITNYEILR